ncbi:amino acid transporter AVT1C-like [Cucurbita moschata]|uniref:Amino acid transporter AVT1C-like n=1 Tax=Cucurbita moschata TaxID=3662 RepID=A0A6J1FIS2_CUCMO|nr:amino acid transporter AVT1C-like [Cucurbita moschata]XP_022938398.1 amino acid transporter AVT1C-like [Cucurbita moschata]XP_022938399.1 amino acid transporter AVT1C-like [Cucurbita moschata]
MKNSISDRSFYIESSDDEDFDKEIDDGNESESSGSSVDNRNINQPSSYNAAAWPQSYRQSIDMLGSLHSPSIGLLGTPSLARFGSSFLSSSLTRRFTPEAFSSSISKPLLPTVIDEQQKYAPYSPLGPQLPSRRSSISVRRDDKDKPVVDSHGLPISRHCSFGQAVVNGINVLCGVGILSTPYAMQQGGWLGLSILLIFAVLSFYTGILLRACLDSKPGLETYPDIGQAAFGAIGRVAISIILYVELYASCIEYVILESDNLSTLFPRAHISFGGFELSAHLLFAIATALAVLPTVWLRDLSILSYISAGGVIASIVVVICLFWVGLVDDVGFHGTVTPLKLSTLPVALGLYGFCYSGHAVFPNIYSSMGKQSQFPAVLLTCFGICTLMYAGVAIMGYLMFGESTLSQYTLNLPQDLVASKIAVWTTVVNPFTKYALTISPVAMSLEEFIPPNHPKTHIYSILIRTALVISTLLVGLSIPFFGLMMSLIGSLLTMLVTLILPCACYLSILRGKVTFLQITLCCIVIAVGVIASAFGSYSSLKKIIEKLSA